MSYGGLKWKKNKSAIVKKWFLLTKSIIHPISIYSFLINILIHQNICFQIYINTSHSRKYANLWLPIKKELFQFLFFISCLKEEYRSQVKLYRLTKKYKWCILDYIIIVILALYIEQCHTTLSNDIKKTNLKRRNRSWRIASIRQWNCCHPRQTDMDCVKRCII